MENIGGAIFNKRQIYRKHWWSQLSYWSRTFLKHWLYRNNTYLF